LASFYTEFFFTYNKILKVMKIMRNWLFILALTVLGTSMSRADEGMWLINKIGELNYTDMQKLGCKLSPEEIYSINNSSLKDAVFQLVGEGDMGFCTGEMISPKGLMLTNHHCAYTAITTLSSTENDYLTHGFWAKTLKDELPIPNMGVSRVVRIEDVSARVLEGVTGGMKESERNELISKAIKEIEKEAKQGHYKVQVKEMFSGNEYYLFVYEFFRDVRLTGAPPSSIGKYGGDTDNWMWPRHTGDFTLLRVYMKPDGSPSEGYDEANVPYKPLHFFPVSLKGVEQGDFTMIIGFPGQTSRFITSYGMEYKLNTFNPTIVRLLDTRLDIMREDMENDDATRIAMADTYAQLANTWKNFQGEAEGLRKTDLIDQKRAFEKQFNEWANKNGEDYHKEVLAGFKTMYQELAPAAKSLIYASFGLLQASQQAMAFQHFGNLKALLEKGKEKAEDAKTEAQRIKNDLLATMFDEYFPATDKKILSAMLKLYFKDIPKEERVDYLKNDFPNKFKAKSEEEMIDKFVEAVFTKSIFTDKARMIAFLDKPNLKALNADPLYDFSMGVVLNLQFGLQGKYVAANRKETSLQRQYIEGVRKMNPDKVFYPDANSTLRLTYGTIQPYDPRDAVHYKYLSYIDGVIEKMDNSHPEFKVPDKLVELYHKKDFGRYADKTGNLPVGFISDNDITGGNSGSPILNGNGEIIGTAFDGNWEWLTSNLVYNPKLQRTINCDIRYVLWVIDKFAGAGHLIEEMTIVQ